MAAARDDLPAEPTTWQVDLLHRCRLFRALERADLATLASVAQTRDYGVGALIIIEGDACDGLLILDRGMVRLFKQVGSDLGAREQTLRLIGPGDAFNEVPVFDEGPNPASAEAIEPSRLLLVPSAALRQTLQTCPAFASSLVADLAGRVRHMLAMVEDLSMRDVRGRVAKILLQAVDPAEGIGAGSQAHRRLTQREMADMAGTAREVVARTLRELAQQGLIGVDRGRITILDPKGLEDLL